MNQLLPELFPTSAHARALGPNAIRNLLSLLQRPDVTSFAGGIPDPDLFPRDRVREAFRTATERGTTDVLQYGGSQGLGELREWIAQHMASHGVPCEAANILITSGSQQGLDLAARLLLDAGDTVLVSDPSYLGALQTFRTRGAVPASLEAERSDDRGVRAAYVVPDHANPTGATMTAPERRALLERAGTGRFAVLEDAAYAELRYDGADAKPPSILALDCEAAGSIEGTRTIYLGTFSKVLAPGLRVGWVCASRPIIDTLVRLKECADLLTSPLNQAIALDLVAGGFGQHVSRLRQVYGARRDAMVDALAARLPAGVTWERPSGGMFVWLILPAELDADHLLPVAVERFGVAFVPGRSFVPDASRGNALRLSFCQYDASRIGAGVERLGALLSEALDPPVRRAS